MAEKRRHVVGREFFEGLEELEQTSTKYTWETSPRHGNAQWQREGETVFRQLTGWGNFFKRGYDNGPRANGSTTC